MWTVVSVIEFTFLLFVQYHYLSGAASRMNIHYHTVTTLSRGWISSTESKTLRWVIYASSLSDEPQLNTVPITPPLRHQIHYRVLISRRVTTQHCVYSNESQRATTSRYLFLSEVQYFGNRSVPVPTRCVRGDIGAWWGHSDDEEGAEARSVAGRRSEPQHEDAGRARGRPRRPLGVRTRARGRRTAAAVRGGHQHLLQHTHTYIIYYHVI